MAQPRWYTLALRQQGLCEYRKGSNPEILRMYEEAAGQEIGQDAVPWCAAFVGAMLKRAGWQSSGSLLARSYMKYGTRSRPQLGAIVVLSRAYGPSWGGHVGFLVRQESERLLVLGGNQADCVNMQYFHKSRLLALR